MFTGSQNGLFTVKSVYRVLTEQVQAQPTVHEKKLWLSIWNMKGTAPKVRFFIWKALRGAIPVAGVIGRRIPGVSKQCKICGNGEESVVHMLFQCTVARTVWFTSPLALHTDGITGELGQILQNLWEGLEHD